MNRYPAFFPEGFEREILPKGAKAESRHVYRIIKNGTINRDSFMSTYEEVVRGLRPMPKKIGLKDPGLYSTSCNYDYEDARYMERVFMRHEPAVFVAEGMTDESCGPCQVTAEREPAKKGSHVDWWIYEDAEPHKFFEEVEQDEK